MPRKWEPHELRMTTDYLIERHPDAVHMTRVRVGPLPPQAAETEREGISPRIYYPTLHWADGIALYPDRSIVLEVKVKLDSRALGQILTNLDLFPDTPEFRDRAELPLSGEVVYAYPDRETLRMLDRHGIRHVQYRPPYIEAYYMEKIRTTYERAPKPRRLSWRDIITEVTS